MAFVECTVGESGKCQGDFENLCISIKKTISAPIQVKWEVTSKSKKCTVKGPEGLLLSNIECVKRKMPAAVLAGR
eukprot:764711-Hanusia_phi.AAC.4